MPRRSPIPKINKRFVVGAMINQYLWEWRSRSTFQAGINLINLFSLFQFPLLTKNIHKELTATFDSKIVGGWTNPSKNMRKSNVDRISPTNQGENQTYLSCHHLVVLLIHWENGWKWWVFTLWNGATPRSLNPRKSRHTLKPRLHNVRLSNSTVSRVLLKSSMSPSDSVGFFHGCPTKSQWVYMPKICNKKCCSISLSSSIHDGLSVSLPLTVNRKYQWWIKYLSGILFTEGSAIK